MSTIAKILKEDIQHITKKELSQITKLLKQSTAELEKTIKTLSLRIEALEKSGQPESTPIKKVIPVKPKPASKKKPSVKSKPVQTKKATGKPISRTPKQNKDKITAQDIISLREKLGLSQKKFAERINGTSSSVSVWERKKGVINIKDDKVKRTILELMGK